MEWLATQIKTVSDRRISMICGALLFIMFITFGLLGVDFGRHWDEPKLLRAVENAFESRRFLPGWYQYPSFTFWIGLLSKYVVVGLNTLTGTELSLTIMWRSVMIAMTALSGLWTYLLAQRITNRHSTALMASGMLMLSPELLYHSRWIAPDALMMQLGILCTLLLYASCSGSSCPRRRLLQASMLAGLACSTKYPGGLFIVPIVLMSWLILPKHKNWSSRLISCAAPTCTFICTVLLTTPGIILETGQFLADVESEIHHYRRGHATYGVAPGLEHLWLNVRYLLLCLSDVTWMQMVLSVPIIGGYIKVVRLGKYAVITFLTVPSLYLIYFSAQRVMIVRNLLVLLPFIVILAAIGMQSIARRLPVDKRIWALCGFIFALTQTQTNLVSANSIGRSADVRVDLARFALTNSHLEIQPSTRLSTDPLAEELNQLPKKENRSIMVVFWSDEHPKIQWVTNRAQRYTIISGQRDVNWSYYPSWLGGRRLLAVSLTDAVKMGLMEPVDQSTRPKP
jgi:hypothetical protein